MRCPDCNKFVSQDPSDPEVNTLAVEQSPGFPGVFNIKAEIRSARTCSECGLELTALDLEGEASITFTETPEFKAKTEEEQKILRDAVLGKLAELDVDEGTTSATEEGSGKGKRIKCVVEFDVTVTAEVVDSKNVTCSVHGTLEAEAHPSEYEEQV